MRNLRIASLDQEFTLPGDLTVRQSVKSGQEFIYNLLAEYESSSTAQSRHEELEHYLNLHDAWHPEVLLNEVMDKLQLNFPDKKIGDLSGGEKRRVALARAIVSQPDLLLLDEPTNHLDIETVKWIEDFLAAYNGTTLLVTHDRFFLDRVANRIVELDHGKFRRLENILRANGKIHSFRRPDNLFCHCINKFRCLFFLHLNNILYENTFCKSQPTGF